jgi:hypothetical protein
MTVVAGTVACAWAGADAPSDTQIAKKTANALSDLLMKLSSENSRSSNLSVEKQPAMEPVGATLVAVPRYVKTLTNAIRSLPLIALDEALSSERCTFVPVIPDSRNIARVGPGKVFCRTQ